MLEMDGGMGFGSGFGLGCQVSGLRFRFGFQFSSMVKSERGEGSWLRVEGVLL